MRLLALLFLISTLAACGLAQPVSASSDEKDERLIKPITLSEPLIDLTGLMAKLSAQTGVHFSAAKDVADFKAAAFLKALPISTVMSGLAATFDLEWEKTGKAPNWNYKLYQSLKKKQAVAALKKRMHDKEIARSKQSIDYYLKKSEGDQLEDLKKQYELNKQLNKLIDEEENQPPDWQRQYDQVSDELAKVILPFDQRLVALVYRQLTLLQKEAFWRGEPIFYSSEAKGQYQMPDSLLKMFNLRTQLENAEPRPYAFLMNITPEGHLQFSQARSAEIELTRDSFFNLRPTSEDLKAVGFPYADEQLKEMLYRKQPPFDEALPNEEIKKFYDSLEKDELTSSLISAPLKILAKCSSHSFLAEVFRTRTNDIKHATTLNVALLIICQLLGASDGSQVDYIPIVQNNSLICLTNAEAPLKRLNEIPERILAPLEARQKKYGGLGFEDWAAFIGQLTSEQIEGLYQSRKLISLNPPRDMIDLFQFWNLLTPQQRTQAAASSGLPYKTLSDSQRKMFEYISTPLSSRMQKTSIIDPEQAVFKRVDDRKQTFTALPKKTGLGGKSFTEWEKLQEFLKTLSAPDDYLFKQQYKEYVLFELINSEKKSFKRYFYSEQSVEIDPKTGEEKKAVSSKK